MDEHPLATEHVPYLQELLKLDVTPLSDKAKNILINSVLDSYTIQQSKSLAERTPTGLQHYSTGYCFSIAGVLHKLKIGDNLAKNYHQALRSRKSMPIHRVSSASVRIKCSYTTRRKLILAEDIAQLKTSNPKLCKKCFPSKWQSTPCWNGEQQVDFLPQKQFENIQFNSRKTLGALPNKIDNLSELVTPVVEEIVKREQVSYLMRLALLNDPRKFMVQALGDAPQVTRFTEIAATQAHSRPTRNVYYLAFVHNLVNNLSQDKLINSLPEKIMLDDKPDFFSLLG